MFVAFMPVAPCVLCAKYVLNTFRRRISIYRNFPASFWNLIPTSFTLIFMFQVPNNLFMSSKLFGFIMFQSVSRNFL